MPNILQHQFIDTRNDLSFKTVQNPKIILFDLGGSDVITTSWNAVICTASEGWKGEGQVHEIRVQRPRVLTDVENPNNETTGGLPGPGWLQ